MSYNENIEGVETHKPDPKKALSSLENFVAVRKEKKGFSLSTEEEKSPDDFENEKRDLQIRAYDAMEWSLKNEINLLSQEHLYLLPALLKIKLEDLAKKNNGLLDWQIQAAKDKQAKMEQFAHASGIDDFKEQDEILDKYGLDRSNIDFEKLRREKAA
ncbi:MAG: hypothetical protein PHU42_00495 [Patescibacteria group bacterium]|nr:hypothetical protein [Patescibacteria group bacterium]